MSADEEEVEAGPVRTALNSSVRGNATAFGFSIMITISYGAVSHVQGQPGLSQLLLFGLGAALAVALLEGAASGGFRHKVRSAGSEVLFLGTAMNLISVAAGTGSAIGMAKLLGSAGGWPAAGFCAAIAYVLAESLEILAAEGIQRLRGDRSADEPQGES
jgi:hypothetical protein